MLSLFHIVLTILFRFILLKRFPAKSTTSTTSPPPFVLALSFNPYDRPLSTFNMANVRVIELKWRDGDGGSRDAIMGRIHSLLTTLDMTGELRVQLAESSKADIIVTKQRNDAAILLRRYDATLKRLGLISQRKWLQTFSDLCIAIVGMMQRKESRKNRQLVYLMDKVKTSKLRDMVDTLSMTVPCHPACLGIEWEQSGKVFIGEGVKVEVDVVENIYAYLEERTTKKMSLRQKDRSEIPGLLAAIRVRAKFGVRAIIFVEHRNIGTTLEWTVTSLKGCIIIMTSGFPTQGTREFVHLLSQLPDLEHTPFLFFSDHDLSGFKIFSMLRNGCKKSAWGSAIMVCPQLQWVGPTTADLFHNLKEVASRRMTEQQKLHPQWSAARLEADKQDFVTRHAKELSDNLTRAGKDKGTWNGMVKMGLLDGEKNRLLRDEGTALASGKRKGFRLSALSSAGYHGMEAFIFRKLDQIIGDGLSLVNPLSTVDLRSEQARRMAEGLRAARQQAVDVQP